MIYEVPRDPWDCKVESLTELKVVEASQVPEEITIFMLS